MLAQDAAKQKGIDMKPNELIVVALLAVLSVAVLYVAFFGIDLHHHMEGPAGAENNASGLALPSNRISHPTAKSPGVFPQGVTHRFGAGQVGVFVGMRESHRTSGSGSFLGSIYPPWG